MQPQPAVGPGPAALLTRPAGVAERIGLTGAGVGPGPPHKPVAMPHPIAHAWLAFALTCAMSALATVMARAMAAFAAMITLNRGRPLLLKLAGSCRAVAMPARAAEMFGPQVVAEIALCASYSTLAVRS
jgi:hypothetical protein